jgi:hypothetical protein
MVYFSTEDFVGTLGDKSHYLSPSSLVTSNLRSFMDNPRTA